MLTPELQSIIDNLTPAERRELDLAKRLLAALVRGQVYNLGGIFCNRADDLPNHLQFSHTDMHDAVRCLQRLGYGVDRVDAGGSPTWELTSMPK